MKFKNTAAKTDVTPTVVFDSWDVVEAEDNNGKFKTSATVTGTFSKAASGASN